jgi:hypothetical protein
MQTTYWITWFEDNILDHLAELVSASSLKVSRDMGVSHDSVQLHPYDPQKVQAMSVAKFSQLLQFA